jgi:hypothetical protein
MGIFLQKKFTIFKRIGQITYLVILIGIAQVFIFNNILDNNLVVNNLSFINYYFYTLINNPLNSFINFSIVYGHINLIAYSLFVYYFKEFKYFLFFIISLNFIILLLNIINVNNHSLFSATIILNIIGYGLGYLIKKLFSFKAF